MISARSFAKINLGIEVLGKRADGYHDIRTLFQTVNFCDHMSFEETGDARITLEGNDPGIPWDESNFIFKAAAAVKAFCSAGQGVRINVRKNIPAGKGLGGGSGNAAAAIVALNRLWSLSLSHDEMRGMASGLGADVPFFLYGGLAQGSGRGDVITPLEDFETMNCVLVLPDLTVLTADIYRRFTLTSTSKDSKIIRFLNGRNFGVLENDLEETVFSLYPQIKSIKSHLSELKASLSLVSGSGSAVVGLFSSRMDAEEAKSELSAQYKTLLVETVSRERYLNSLITGV